MNDSNSLLDWLADVAAKNGFGDEPAPRPLVEDVQDDDFWKDLETRAAEGLYNWLNNSYGQAIETFSDDLSKQKGSDPDAIAWKMTKSVLSLIPHTKIPIKAAEIGLTLANGLPGKTQSLEDFLHKARGVKEKLGKEILRRKHPLFDQLRGWAQDPRLGNDADHRSSADTAISNAIDGLAPSNKILKGMIDDWVNATEDNYDAWDHDTYDDAGYVYIDVIYDQSKGKWSYREGPHIDDLEKSAGARKALEHSYGANTALTQLPYHAKANFTFVVDLSLLSAAEIAAHILSKITSPAGGAELRYLLKKGGAGKFSECKRADLDMGWFKKAPLPSGVPSDAQACKLFNAHFAKLKVKDLKDE